MAMRVPKLSREELIEEARKETLAIQRLMIWQRLGYSAVALGFLFGWWGFYGDGPFAVGILGVVVLALGAIVSLILFVGTNNGKKNVRALMEAAGVDMDAEPAQVAKNAEHVYQKASK